MDLISGVQTSEIRLADAPEPTPELPKMETVAGVQSTEIKLTQPKTSEEPPDDKFDEILHKLEDPNTPIVEVSRMITIELGKVAQKAVRLGNEPQEAWKQKAWETQVKVLTALAKQCQDTDILSKKDALNFDGPKFQFVLAEIVAVFKQTLVDVGLDPTMVNNAMVQLRDSMALAEPRIRRDAERVDAKIK